MLKRLPAVCGALSVVVVSAGCFNLLFPYAPDQTAETLLRASCNFAFNCCDAAERPEAFASATRDEATCVEEGLEEGGSSTILGQRVQAAIALGNAEYDQALAEKCLKPIVDAANACDARAFLRPEVSAECNSALARGFAIGKVKDGDDCTDEI